MSRALALAAQVRALVRQGTGDTVGLALVDTLLARAAALPAAGRARLAARAEALFAAYSARSPEASRLPAPREGCDDAWREALAARARARPARAPRAERSATLMTEIRASAATARAADQVPEAAGPYNGAAVASRALDELAALAPDYVGGYVTLLEDLACLGDLPEHRAERRKPRRKA